MALAVGERLGPYEIVARIGAGGMGEVYRARDTRLNREVAIKVSAEQFSDRFEREARSIAALNHPNICTLYDVGPNYLVMELVEGPTLADRIEEGPVPLDEALVIARQIAEALEAAHEKGIVHRDLKPGNVKLKPDGSVKVLDFGLAKVTDFREGSPEQSPTLTFQQATRAGMILGTAAYMAPEQARGKNVDKRADIWAFGVVVYEMLTGRAAFRGETITDVLASVVKDEPDLARVPAKVRRLLKACLEKDPKQRLQAIGDWRLLVDDAPQVEEQRRSILPWAVAGVLGMALLAALALLLRGRAPRADEESMLHVSLHPPAGAQFLLETNGGSAISPNGRLVAFVAITNAARIWVRALDSLTARELPGTEEARNPFWSPDSRSIAFFASGKLKRVDLDAGSPVEIAEFQAARGGSWSSNGTILFNPLAPDALVQVSATGGTPTQLTHPDEANGEISHRYPDFLPDGKRFIFFVRSHNPHSNGIYLSSLDHPDTKTMLVESTSPGVYAVPHGKHPGYLLWLRQDTLTAQPFDPESARLSGEPRVVPSVANVAFNSGFSLAAFSVAQDGKLLYASGSDRYQMTWYSREGKVLGTVGEPDRYVDIRISPNGKQVVSAIDSPTGPYLWLRDFSSDRQTRLIFDIPTYVAAWSPDGRRVAYHGLVKRQLFESPTDGSGRQEAVMQSPRNVFINDWSPDGRSILYNEISPKARLELWVLTNVDDIRQRKAVPLLQTAFNESPATFSTDGKWIAYTSDRSGRKDIYVQQFTVGSGNSARTWLVSNAGGNYPRWRRDGKELFYQALNGKLMVIPVRAGTEGLEFGNPTALFSIVGPLGMVSYNYDVAPDGRILVLAPSGGGTSLTLLTNWQAAVNK